MRKSINSMWLSVFLSIYMDYFILFFENPIKNHLIEY